MQADAYELMERKIAEEQEFIRSLEERKKILMHDDNTNYENTEEQEIGVQQNRDNGVTMMSIIPAYPTSEVRN